MLKRSRRDGKNTQKILYKKYINELDTCCGVVSHPEPDILECKGRWSLSSTAVNKAKWMWWNSSRTTQIPKGGCHQDFAFICQQIWKTQKWPQNWKRSIFIPIPKKSSTKECANQWTVALISSYLKSCTPGFSIVWIKNFKMSQLGLDKEEELEIKLTTFAGL